MPWVRFEAGFHQHPKIAPLSSAALALHVTAISWSALHLTDGKVPQVMLKLLLSGEDLRVIKRATRELVASNVWVAHEDFYEIHDFAKYQFTKAEVEKHRAGARERKRKSRASHAEVTLRSRVTGSDGHTIYETRRDENDKERKVEAVRSAPDNTNLIPLPDNRISNGGLDLTRGVLEAIQAGRRSWDLFQIASRVWDEIAPPEQLAPRIRFAIDYCRALGPEEVDGGRVGTLVKRHGKAALLGIDEGLARGLAGDGLWRYAEKVAQAAKKRIAEGGA